MSHPRLTFFCELGPAPLKALFSLPDIVILADIGATVSLGILDFSPERAEVVSRLNQAGVPVVAWLLLPKDQGYWFNVDNASEAQIRYQEFQKWTRENGLTWAGIGLDIEPDIRELEKLAKEKLRLVPFYLQRTFKRRRLEQARKLYRDLLKTIRSDSYRVDGYQLPLIVDERISKSTLLQKMIGLVDIPVDREVLMLYSSFLRPYGPGVIWSYGSNAEAIAVGSTGIGQDFNILNHRYLSWEEFARDLRLAWVFTDDIYIYSLEGCLEHGYLSRLKNFEWDQPLFDPDDLALRVDRFRHSLQTVLWLGSRLHFVLIGMLAGYLTISRLLRRKPDKKRI
jgi:hypothetical protein